MLNIFFLLIIMLFSNTNKNDLPYKKIQEKNFPRKKNRTHNLTPKSSKEENKKRLFLSSQIAERKKGKKDFF